MDKRPDGNRQRSGMSRRPAGKTPDDMRRTRGQKPKGRPEEGFFAYLKQAFSQENLRFQGTLLLYRAKNLAHTLGVQIFYARERILCGAVCAVIMIFLTLLQTTVFSTLQPFGAIPDIMLSFVVALSVTEGRKWGAVWGLIASVIIESLGVPGIVLLPMLYMPVGFFVGILCRYYFTGSAAVRALLTLAVLPLRGIFTAIYTVLSPMSASAGEIFFEIVLPEAAATLLLAIPVHLLMYVCLRPFHRTRAEKVSDI